jgi:hypothetical protein
VEQVCLGSQLLRVDSIAGSCLELLAFLAPTDALICG